MVDKGTLMPAFQTPTHHRSYSTNHYVSGPPEGGTDDGNITYHTPVLLLMHHSNCCERDSAEEEEVKKLLKYTQSRIASGFPLLMQLFSHFFIVDRSILCTTLGTI